MIQDIYTYIYTYLNLCIHHFFNMTSWQERSACLASARRCASVSTATTALEVMANLYTRNNQVTDVPVQSTVSLGRFYSLTQTTRETFISMILTQYFRNNFNQNSIQVAESHCHQHHKCHQRPFHTVDGRQCVEQHSQESPQTTLLDKKWIQAFLPKKSIIYFYENISCHHI